MSSEYLKILNNLEQMTERTLKDMKYQLGQLKQQLENQQRTEDLGGQINALIQ